MSNPTNIPGLSDLLRRLLEQEDEAAYREFARRAHRKIFAFYRRRLRVPRYQAEDLTESTITKIIIKFRQYEPKDGASFESWMMTLARNEGFQWLRDLHKRAEVFDDTVADLASIADTEPGASDPATASAVREAVKQLSEKDQLILELTKYRKEADYDEIAKTLGVSYGAARVRVYWAYARLRKILAADSRIRLRRTA